jgi:MYXO-CTERM domain-containing protein
MNPFTRLAKLLAVALMVSVSSVHGSTFDGTLAGNLITGISHTSATVDAYTLLSVPEGGASAAILGVGMLALVWMRRRRQKAALSWKRIWSL